MIQSFFDLQKAFRELQSPVWEVPTLPAHGLGLGGASPSPRLPDPTWVYPQACNLESTCDQNCLATSPLGSNEQANDIKARILLESNADGPHGFSSAFLDVLSGAKNFVLYQL